VDTENEGQLSLQLRRVHDNNLLAFLSRQNRENYWERSAPNQNLDAPIWTNTLSLNGSGPVDIDLSEALSVAGHGVYQLQVSGKNSEQQIERLFLVSDLGLLARRQGNDELLVWAVGLSDSAAVADAAVLALAQAYAAEPRAARLIPSPTPATDSWVLATLSSAVPIRASRAWLTDSPRRATDRLAAWVGLSFSCSASTSWRSSASWASSKFSCRSIHQ
jgi:hypothetical protein